MKTSDSLKRMLFELTGVKFHFGATRVVVVFQGLAVKFARSEDGRRCNRFEQHVWTCHGSHLTKGPHLCPVIWCEEQGRLLVMPAATPLTTAQVPAIKRNANRWWKWEPGGAHSPWEHKEEDWGMLEGRMVCVDYAMPALSELDPFEVGMWGFAN